MSYNIDLRPLIWLGAFFVLIIWGCWELVDWAFIDHSIESPTLIVPEIKLVVKNNTVDTIYIYRQP